MKTLDGTLSRRALDCSGPQSAHTRVVSRAGGQSPLWVPTLTRPPSRSALPLWPDIDRRTRQVRFVPILLQKSKIERPRKSRES